MKHTPGPWRIDEPVACGVIVAGSEEDGSLRYVAQEVDERDMLLVAAAPELLAALELVLSISHDPRATSDRHLALTEDSPMMEEVRAAIAKAKGE